MVRQILINERAQPRIEQEVELYPVLDIIVREDEPIRAICTIIYSPNIRKSSSKSMYILAPEFPLIPFV